jgi:hypothetical protein
MSNALHIGNPFDTHTDPQHKLGQLMELPDGRKFRYSQAGLVALTPGTLQQTAVELTNHANMAVGAVTAIGATSVLVTPGATAGAANLYSEGYLVITDSTGKGYSYKVSTHAAIVASTQFTVNLKDPIVVALATSTKATLQINPWKNTLIYPSTATGGVVGVAPTNVAASSYYWCQTGGVANVLCDGNWTVGAMLSPSNATAGAAEVGVLAQGYIGNALTTGITTAYMPVMLTLD